MFDVRVVGHGTFQLSRIGRGAPTVVTVQRRHGFSGQSWEARELCVGSDLRRSADSGSKTLFTAKRATKEDGTLRWCDANGRLIATDTKLVRRRGNHENHFLMPVLTVVADIEQEVLDVLVASWLARVWCEVVQAKKKTLMDGAYH